MRRLLFGGVALVCACSLWASERIDDGYGLVDALKSTSGNGDATYPFRFYEAALTGGNVGSQATVTMDRSLPNTWAPSAVYQLERYGAQSAKISGLTPNATYIAELHLSENYFGGMAGTGGAGNRKGNYFLNEELVESAFDIYVQAGGAFRGICRQHEVKANESGEIIMRLANVVDNAHWSGFAVFGKSAPTLSSNLTISNPEGSVDVVAKWSDMRDVLRYYLEKSEDGNNWITMATALPSDTSITLSSAYNALLATQYRLVLSNGICVVRSNPVTLGGASTGTSLATTGSKVNNDPTALYTIDTVGDESAGANTLATDEVSATGYILKANGDSTLELADGQTFATASIGVGEVARCLTIEGPGTLKGINGGITFSVDPVDAVLKVLSPIDGAAGALAKLGTGDALITDSVHDFASWSVNGGNLIFTNATEKTYNLPILKGVGKFVKTGAGEVVITNTNPEFSGEFIVRQGSLLFGREKNAFDNTDMTLRIENGAKLSLGTDKMGFCTVYYPRTVYFEGSGVDGKGVIVNETSQCQYNALANGVMTGDAVLGGSYPSKNATNGRWDFRSGTFDFAGHSIRKIGYNMVCLTGMNLLGLDQGGVTIDVEQGYWSSETTTSYTGGSANKFHVYDGATLDFYSMSNPITWAMDFENNSWLWFRLGSRNQNIVTGSVTLKSGNVYMGSVGSHYGTIEGPISGEGKLVVKAEGAGCVILSGENSYTGGTLVMGGDMEATYPKSLPNWETAGNVCISNATLFLVTGKENNWTEDQFHTLLGQENLFFNDVSVLGVTVYEGDDVVWTKPLEYTTGSFAKFGSGSFTLQDDLILSAENGYLNNRGGNLIFDGCNVQAKKIYAQMSSKTILTNGTQLTMSAKSGYTYNIGTTQFNTSEVFVEKDSTIKGDTDCAINTATAAINIGTELGARGILVVNPDATVKMKICLGLNNNQAQGALIQNGGVVENQGGAANDIQIGSSGYGYVELNDGVQSMWGYATLGTAVGSMGMVYQHGGTMLYVPKLSAGRLGFSRGGSGYYYMDGGKIDYTATGVFLALGEMDSNGQGTDTRSTLTIEGENTLAEFGNKGTWLGNRYNHTAVINLNNGGTLSCGTFSTSSNYGSTNRNTVVALLNFNGGVFRAPASINMAGSGAYCPDAFTVYQNGAILDSSNFTLTVNAPLVKPTGKGVSAITLPSAVLNTTEYIGAPSLKIYGGGGRGATAICLYDSKTRRVTGVKITSPGTDYTNAPSVQITGGGYTNVYTTTATLADNVTTGGLTVRGDGTVKLTANNTFEGAITLESGILEAYPKTLVSGCELIFDGGTLELQGGVYTASVVRVRSGGVIKNGYIYCDNYIQEGDGTLQMQYASIIPNTPATGLYAGMLAGGFNLTDPNPCTSIEAAPARANLLTGWGSNETWVYTGYIWNREATNQTWTFLKYFDDGILLKIDDQELINASNWSDFIHVNYVITPGAHKFELRLGQGTGSAGPSTCNAQPAFADMGFGVDFYGRNSNDRSTYVKLEDYANIDELFTPEIANRLEQGHLEVTTPAFIPGLFEGVVSGNANLTTVNPKSSIQLYPVKANTTLNWEDNTTAIYTGYIWNRTSENVTWTFGETFDDITVMWIDDEIVLDDRGWDNLGIGTTTLTPGPHKFEVRFGQGSGGAGPSSVIKNELDGVTPSWGFALDKLGRNEARNSNFILARDTGDGELWTVNISDVHFGSADAPLHLAENATINVSGTAESVVLGGLDCSQGAITGGDAEVKYLLETTASALLANQHLVVNDGYFKLAAGAQVRVWGLNSLPHASYVLVEAAEGIKVDSDKVTLLDNTADNKWKVYKQGNKLILGYPSGTVIYFR